MVRYTVKSPTLFTSLFSMFLSAFFPPRNGIEFDIFFCSIHNEIVLHFSCLACISLFSFVLLQFTTTCWSGHCLFEWNFCFQVQIKIDCKSQNVNSEPHRQIVIISSDSRQSLNAPFTYSFHSFSFQPFAIDFDNNFANWKWNANGKMHTQNNQNELANWKRFSSSSASFVCFHFNLFVGRFPCLIFLGFCVKQRLGHLRFSMISFAALFCEKKAIFRKHFSVSVYLWIEIQLHSNTWTK